MIKCLLLEFFSQRINLPTNFLKIGTTFVDELQIHARGVLQTLITFLVAEFPSFIESIRLNKQTGNQIKSFLNGSCLYADDRNWN